MREIKERYLQLKEKLKGKTLVAVSKKRTTFQILDLYNLGHRDFGENKVQEFLEKKPKLPEDIRWHFIGHLQKNKVNKVVGEVDLIHSVDSLELAEKIGERAKSQGITCAILLQVNTSGEASKYGLSVDQFEKEAQAFKGIEGIEIKGLMTMAPLTEDQELIRHSFIVLRGLQETHFPGGELSMGMSHDYEIALEEGASIVRIGSFIFD